MQVSMLMRLPGLVYLSCSPLERTPWPRRRVVNPYLDEKINPQDATRLRGREVVWPASTCPTTEPTGTLDRYPNYILAAYMAFCTSVTTLNED
jgi:hypothetical protein